MKFKNISKSMSKALRHDPAFLKINLDEHGWVDAGVLYESLRVKFPQATDFDYNQFEALIDSCEKQRFGWNENRTRVRANQGHSIGVNLELKPQKAPDKLYHGTSQSTEELILKDGLRRMKRQHVHLSLDYETAIKVGSRHGKPMVFLVKAREHQQETGAEYFLSENGVWLTEHVPVKYLD